MQLWAIGQGGNRLGKGGDAALGNERAKVHCQGRFWVAVSRDDAVLGRTYMYRACLQHPSAATDGQSRWSGSCAASPGNKPLNLARRGERWTRSGHGP